MEGRKGVPRVTVVRKTNWCLNQDSSWPVIAAGIVTSSFCVRVAKMSNTPPDNEHIGRLMTPLATGDTPLPVRDTNALLSSYVSAGSRPREHLLSPASFPREEPTSNRSFLPLPPPFEAPAAGSCKIAIAVQQTGNTRVAIPVVYAVQSSGAHVVFPFTRQLLGVVWRTVAEL